MSMAVRLVVAGAMAAVAPLVLCSCDGSAPSPAPSTTAASFTSGVDGVMTIEGGPAPGSPRLAYSSASVCAQMSATNPSRSIIEGGVGVAVWTGPPYREVQTEAPAKAEHGAGRLADVAWPAITGSSGGPPGTRMVVSHPERSMTTIGGPPPGPGAAPLVSA